MLLSELCWRGNEKLRLADDVFVADKVGLGGANLGRRLEGALPGVIRRMDHHRETELHGDVVSPGAGSDAVAMVKDRARGPYQEARPTVMQAQRLSRTGRDEGSCYRSDMSGVMRRTATRRFARSGPGVLIFRCCSP
jgi:hypothetical protein